MSLRNIIKIILASLIIGSLSVLYVTKYFSGDSTEKNGIWFTISPSKQSSSDPYKTIYQIRHSYLPLGRVEGLSFWTDHDDNNKFLYSNCTYLLEGVHIKTSFFTIYVADYYLHPIMHGNHASAISSYDLVQEKAGKFFIYLSAYPQNNNWLQTTNINKYKLVLNLYNTPFIAPSGLHKLVLPKIKRLFCGVPS